MEEPKGLTAAGPDFLLQWGSRKRLRCVKTRDGSSSTATATPSGLRRPAARASRRMLSETIAITSPSQQRSNLLRYRKSGSVGNKCRKSLSMSPSPEKDHLYTTRGSMLEENADLFRYTEERSANVSLPRFFISLSNKEKEEDFMAMKGCKLPQRPKKRPKLMQKCLLLVSPGAWLSDLTQERYEVREKKCSKKRTKGLKAMCMESDSE